MDLAEWLEILQFFKPQITTVLGEIHTPWSVGSDLNEEDFMATNLPIKSMTLKTGKLLLVSKKNNPVNSEVNDTAKNKTNNPYHVQEIPILAHGRFQINGLQNGQTYELFYFYKNNYNIGVLHEKFTYQNKPIFLKLKAKREHYISFSNYAISDGVKPANSDNLTIHLPYLTYNEKNQPVWMSQTLTHPDPSNNYSLFLNKGDWFIGKNNDLYQTIFIRHSDRFLERPLTEKEIKLCRGQKLSTAQ